MLAFGGFLPMKSYIHAFSIILSSPSPAPRLAFPVFFKSRSHTSPQTGNGLLSTLYRSVETDVARFSYIKPQSKEGLTSVQLDYRYETLLGVTAIITGAVPVNQ